MPRGWEGDQGGSGGVHARTHTLEPTELLSEKDDPAKPAASSSEGSPHAPSPGLCIKPGRGPSCLAPRNKALVPAASLTLRLLSGKVRVLWASKRLICRPLKRAWGLATLWSVPSRLPALSFCCSHTHTVLQMTHAPVPQSSLFSPHTPTAAPPAPEVHGGAAASGAEKAQPPLRDICSG